MLHRTHYIYILYVGGRYPYTHPTCTKDMGCPLINSPNKAHSYFPFLSLQTLPCLFTVILSSFPLYFIIFKTQWTFFQFISPILKVLIDIAKFSILCSEISHDLFVQNLYRRWSFSVLTSSVPFQPLILKINGCNGWVLFLFLKKKIV